MKTMKHIVYLILVLFTVSCNSPKSQTNTNNETAEVSETASDSEVNEPVDAVSGATNVVNPPSFNGTIIMPPQGHNTITLSMGGSVQKVNVLPGEYVRKGEVILTLANPAFIELQQSYLDAAAQSEYLEKEYARQKNLVSHEAASQKNMQQSKANYLSMKSRMEATAAQLTLQGVDVKQLTAEGISTYLDIKAPQNGYVTNMTVNAGKYFDAGEPVCDVVDKSMPMLQLTAYEKDLSKLQDGSEFDFQVNGMPDTTFKARLVSVDQMVDNSNRSIKVYARIENPHPNFRPGMYVAARITDKKQ